jgi:hypothetical protein
MATKTNETTRKILEHLFSLGCFAWRNNTTGIPSATGFHTSAKKGVPDILGCLPQGRFLAIEVKTGTDRVRPEQEGFIASVLHCGGIAFVAKDYPDYLNKIKPWLK